ncbi:MAG TPA: acetate kinase [Elusimicrobiota bacterium]|nr:acetate kinase [Elusimicrobiota bacterium]
MKVIVLNCGSSSLKYQLFDMPAEQVLAKGLVERIGVTRAGDAPCFHHQRGDAKWEWNWPMTDHRTAVKKMLEVLTGPETGSLKSIAEIQAVGHRVVHGGPRYTRPVLVDSNVVEDIEVYSMYAPLHNPANALGIRVMREVLPSVPNIAVFDTSFHHTLPPQAFLYGLNGEIAGKYGIRRYGFHGLSHQYVSERAAMFLGKPLSSLRLVTCHIGNGTSICAVDGGKSVDISMGMTPLEGVIMGTRSGTIDPSIVELLMEKEKLNFQEIIDLLNRKSGLLGLSGVSSDIRDLEKAAREGHRRAQGALDVHTYQIKKYIGSYIFAMNGVDAIIFTAGIGENSSRCRAEICRHLDFLDTWLDEDKNRNCTGEALINTPDSKIKIAVIPTNEEIMIARATMAWK